MKNDSGKISNGVKHIILIGFKHTGKSSIGKRLAERLGLSFQELDSIVQDIDERTQGSRRKPREIMRAEGEPHFRTLETEALKTALARSDATVIAAGGGTPMNPENRELIGEHTVVLVQAPKGLTYERIMVHGKPAFFPDNEDPYVVFQRIFAEREPVFQELAHVTIMNDGTLEESVEKTLAAFQSVSRE